VHGEAARPARHWYFVKRALDRRPAVLLANRGAGQESQTAATNIAALIATVAAQSGTRILNAADPDSPTTLEISRTIARHVDHEWREVLLDDTAPAGLGRTPWDRPYPFVLDMTAASALGYRPAGTFCTTVAEEIDWLVSIATRTATGVKLPAPADDGFFDGRFDYQAEDVYLSSLR
jgi:hypothetical protein